MNTALAPIYLDNQATTPTDPRVVAAMLPWLGLEQVGNPHSEHTAGQRAAAAVERARAQVAELIGADPSEIIFTSGATEANNLAIQGVTRAPRRRGNHLVTAATEHKCVLEAFAYLRHTGAEAQLMPVMPSGLIDLDALRGALRDDTALVSVMTANNEIGVVQPIAEIAALCNARGIPFHTDAAQAAGKLPIDVKASGVDLLSVSGHKIYAPIGIGALYVSADLELDLEPLIRGGSQERGLRPGTVPTFMCVAFGEACAIASREMEQHRQHTLALREQFLGIIRSALPDAHVNGDLMQRLPSNLSLVFPGVDAEHLIGALQPSIAISTGSACTAGTLQPSHVLQALGLNAAAASGTVRIGFGRFNDAAQVAAAASEIARVAAAIRNGKSVRKTAA